MPPLSCPAQNMLSSKAPASQPGWLHLSPGKYQCLHSPVRHRTCSHPRLHPANPAGYTSHLASINASTLLSGTEHALIQGSIQPTRLVTSLIGLQRKQYLMQLVRATRSVFCQIHVNMLPYAYGPTLKMAEISTTFSNAFCCNENFWFSHKITLYIYIPYDLILNKPSLVQIMAWHRTGNMPLSKPKMPWFTDASIRRSVTMNWDQSTSFDKCWQVIAQMLWILLVRHMV